MPKLINYFQKTLSAKLSFWVVVFVAALFVAALSVMSHYARQAVIEEAIARSEQTLQTSVLSIENILHRTEVIANNMCDYAEGHLANPDDMLFLSRQMIETNPGIVGCAICFEPDFYPQKGRLFMAYHFRRGNKVLSSDHFGSTPYLEQDWYARPKTSGSPGWAEPLPKDTTTEHPIITYSTPIRQNGRLVGILAVDIPLDDLSRIVQEARPYPNTFCALLGKSGNFIIHPDTAMLAPGAMFRQLRHIDAKSAALAKAMLDGDSGYMEINLYGVDCYAFYKPFKNTNWSIDIICSKAELFAPYYQLMTITMLLTFGGLILLLVFCRLFIHNQLNPLEELDTSIKQLTAGNFTQPVTISKRHDEVGDLQKSFYAMQQAIVSKLDEIQQSSKMLNEQKEALRAAFARTQEADRVKAVFLHSVTNQLAPPVNAINDIVSNIHTHHDILKQADISRMAEQMQTYTDTIINLLQQMIKVSENDRKP